MIPDNSRLISIGDDAFIETLITKICLPSCIKIIGGNAFSEARKLKYVSIPNDAKLEEIDSSAFVNTAIDKFILPYNVTKICSELQRFEIPNNTKLNSIERGAFVFTAIKSLIIPAQVTRIEDDSFSFLCDLQIIEFDEDSSLNDFIDQFKDLKNTIIMIPTKMRRNLKT